MHRYLLMHDWVDDVTLYSFRTDKPYPGQMFHCGGMDEEIGMHLEKVLEHFDIDYEPMRNESIRIEERPVETWIRF